MEFKPTSEFAKNIICPVCRGARLAWDERGSAVCADCGARHPFCDGVWFAIVPDKSWRSVLQDTVSLFMDFNANRDAVKEAVGLSVQEQAEGYSKSHEEERDALFFEVWERLNIDKDSRILETGAGDLRMAAALWRMGYRVTATEPTPEFLRRGLFDAGLPVPKVCCSATRLPFADGAFDVVFCEATLHHLDNIAPVVSEMSRVLRQGGMLLIAAEPYSALFSSEERLRETTPDFSYDIGINEHVPRFGEYYRALKKSGIGDIRAYSRGGDVRLPGKAARIPFVSSFFSPSDFFGGGFMMHLRHGFTHGQVSLIGRRIEHKSGAARMAEAGQKPDGIKAEKFLFDPEDYIFRRDREHLAGIWKRLLDLEKTASEICVGINDISELRRGFSRRRCDENGVGFKWLIARGAFFLKVKPEHKELRLRVKAPADIGTGAVEFRVLQDGARVFYGAAKAGEWTDISCKTAPVVSQTICEFIIESDDIRLREGEPSSLMINSIRCV